MHINFAATHGFKWNAPSVKPPQKANNPGGLSDIVVVAVKCDNDAEFVSTDRFDPYTNTWEKHTPELGQHVLAWTDIKVPW